MQLKKLQCQYLLSIISIVNNSCTTTYLVLQKIFSVTRGGPRSTNIIGRTKISLSPLASPAYDNRNLSHCGGSIDANGRVKKSFLPTMIGLQTTICTVTIATNIGKFKIYLMIDCVFVICFLTMIDFFN